MVSNQSNLNERLDYLLYRADKLLARAQEYDSIKQAGTKVDPEVQRNLKMASLINRSSDREIFNTCMDFMNGKISAGIFPTAADAAEVKQRNLKQAGAATPEEILKDCMEFGGMN